MNVAILLQMFKGITICQWEVIVMILLLAQVELWVCSMAPLAFIKLLCSIYLLPFWQQGCKGPQRSSDVVCRNSCNLGKCPCQGYVDFKKSFISKASFVLLGFSGRSISLLPITQGSGSTSMQSIFPDKYQVDREEASSFIGSQKFYLAKLVERHIQAYSQKNNYEGN